jgi:hypothetical protein
MQTNVHDGMNILHTEILEKRKGLFSSYLNWLQSKWNKQVKLVKRYVHKEYA